MCRRTPPHQPPTFPYSSIQIYGEKKQTTQISTIAPCHAGMCLKKQCKETIIQHMRTRQRLSSRLVRMIPVFLSIFSLSLVWANAIFIRFLGSRSSNCERTSRRLQHCLTADSLWMHRNYVIRFMHVMWRTLDNITRTATQTIRNETPALEPIKNDATHHGAKSLVFLSRPGN